MRLAALVLWLLLGAVPAHAEEAPVRIAVQCESAGRTKACTAFLQGFIDAHDVMQLSPRAGADVVVYATSTEFALIDRMHLRFVGRMAGAPPVIEIDVELDTRGTDDEQRAQLQPAFMRGISLFVAARHPQAVNVTFASPQKLPTAVKQDGSPWGFLVETGANGNYTERYKSATAKLNIIGRWIQPNQRALGGVFSNAGLTRQPPLRLDDGRVVSLDAQQWSFRPGAEYVRLLDDTWSLGAGSYTSFEDDKGQFVYSNRTRAAIEWDKFRSDDPRGNHLGVFYSLGWITERYQIRNEIGEAFATYPVHGISAYGTLRVDKLEFGLELESEIMLLHPLRRYTIAMSPRVAIQLGDRVDLSLSLSLIQRELPGPDMSVIDPSDFAQLSRLQYAEPFTLNGSINLVFHWDPTNGVRNDRIASI